MAASTLLRVVPVVISFVCLLLYGVGNGWVASREGSDGVELPRGQLPDLIGTGAALTLSCGAVLASVYLFGSRPPDKAAAAVERRTIMSMHLEDLLARPHPGLKPAQLASLHSALGGLTFDKNPGEALKHYAAAIELTPAEPNLLCDFGDRLMQNGQFDRAMSVYQRVLELAPDHEVAESRLREVRRRLRPKEP